MADADAPTGGGLNLGALAVAATGLFTVLGGISLTGNVGRVVRSDPDAVVVGVVLVLVGAAFLAAAGLPATGNFMEGVLTALGLELPLAGLLVGLIAGISSAGNGARPAVTAKLSADGTRITGSAAADNLESDGQLAVAIHGWTGDGPNAATNIERAYVGPDSDGKAKLPFDVRIPARGFDSVTVTASARGDRAPCAQGDVAESRTACVTITLPKAASVPTLQTSWRGNGATASRLEV